MYTFDLVGVCSFVVLRIVYVTGLPSFSRRKCEQRKERICTDKVVKRHHGSEQTNWSEWPLKGLFYQVRCQGRRHCRTESVRVPALQYSPWPRDSCVEVGRDGLKGEPVGQLPRAQRRPWNNHTLGASKLRCHTLDSISPNIIRSLRTRQKISPSFQAESLKNVDLHGRRIISRPGGPNISGRP